MVVATRTWSARALDSTLTGTTALAELTWSDRTRKVAVAVGPVALRYISTWPSNEHYFTCTIVDCDAAES